MGVYQATLAIMSHTWTEQINLFDCNEYAL